MHFRQVLQAEKAQLQGYVEAMMPFARKHDEVELQKLVGWQRNMKSKGANKEKPVRPDVAFWFPPADSNIRG